MCGFVGIVQSESRSSVAPGLVHEATRAIAHRGPDDEGFHHGRHISLGFRRLAIIDPSDAGNQPMRSADGRYRIVFNGEIYNHVELRQELLDRGVALRSKCDTETLLELFALHGPALLPRLRGMFAFAIWDGEENRLFAARDRFGIKPFFYRLNDGALFFASEKKALLIGNGHGELDPVALRCFLTFQYVPTPATMAPDVRALPAGHILSFRLGEELEVDRYWRNDLKPAAVPPNDRAEQIRTALRDSVRLHMRSDVPVGAFLSGGIDSATICALAAEIRPDLETFTVGFSETDFSEIERAGDLASRLGVRANTYVITPEEFVAELPRIVWHLDDPFGDAAAMALWFLAREARKKVKVVLSGEGADELFGGYHVYRDSEALAPQYLGADEVYLEEELPSITPLRGSGARDVAASFHRRARSCGLDDVATRQLIDLNLWLPGDILTKADRMTMAHGLELRVPFLDKEVMTVASQLARSEKIAGEMTKVAFREAVQDIAPAPAVLRPKLGFPVPIRVWLRDELYDFTEELLATACTEAYIDRRAALKQLTAYRRGAQFDWRRIWVLICFSLWHQVHVEGLYDPVKERWMLP